MSRNNKHDKQGLIPHSPVLAAVCSLESVDSSNTFVSHAISTLPATDARKRVVSLAQQPGWLPGMTGVVPHIAEGSRPTMALAIPDTQTKGRGRLHRAWYDHQGQSFLATWALAVPTELLLGTQSGWLPMAVGIAAMDGLTQTLRECHAYSLDSNNTDVCLALKWPNDIFCSDHKLAGVLCEAVTVNQDWSVLVAGLGINLFVPAGELPTPDATSLQLHYGSLPDFASLRKVLAVHISEHLSEIFSALIENPTKACADLQKRVEQCSWTLGKRVQVQPVRGESIVGKAVSLSVNGSLQVQTDDGRIRLVSTADVGVLPTV